MGLYKSAPPLAGRIGTLWTLATIKESAVVEFGCMGHTVYARTFLSKMGAQGSQLYSTHIRETDIAMGDTSRLSNAVIEILEDKSIKTIFLLPSTVPEIIGIDIKAIAMELSFEYPEIEFITFNTGSFNMQLSTGVEKTLLTLAKKLSRDEEKSEKPSYNIIGSCADMFNFNADCIELERLLESALNIDKNCVMTSNTSVTELRNMAKAHINIVIRQEGLETAKYLEKKYGTPYIYQRPYGLANTVKWLEEIKAVLNLEINEEFIKNEKADYVQLTTPYKVLLQRYMIAHGESASKLIAVGHKDVVNGMCEVCASEYNVRHITKYSDNMELQSEDMPYISDKNKEEIKNWEKCFLMGSGDVIKLFDNVGIHIANPCDIWQHPYVAPFVGVRGAINIGVALINEIAKID